MFLMLQVILTLMAAAVPFVLLLWWLDTLIKRSQRKHEQAGYQPPLERRGFEVKLNTGEPPVAQRDTNL